MSEPRNPRHKRVYSRVDPENSRSKSLQVLERERTKIREPVRKPQLKNTKQKQV